MKSGVLTPPLIAPTIRDRVYLTHDHYRDSLTGRSRWPYRAMAPLLFLSVVLAATRAFLSGKSWMIFFEDDVFYYLKVAQNLVGGHGSTFNGVVPTNGYHPLWLLTLTAVSFFTTSGWLIFCSIAAISLVATMSTFFLADRLLEQARVGPLLRRSFAAYIAIYAMHIFYTGMEVILAVPLMFLVIVVLGKRHFWQRGFWPSFALGLLASAMILARLDLIIFAGLLAFWTLINPQVRRTLNLRHLAGIALGLTPFVFYLFLNHHSFGTWLPISGMAKQLKFTHSPSLKPWASVYGHNVNNWLNLLPIHLAVLALPFVWKRLQPMQKVIFPSVLLFPFVYILVLSCVSDWQLWLWYLYPMRAALCVSFILFSLVPATARVLRTPLVTIAILLVILGEVATSKWWTDAQPPIYAAAVEIEQFAHTHPGVYAMGDRSGMVAYLIPHPVIQTEGLVMDRSFLDHIRRQDPLLATLAPFHVRYYIGTAWKPYNGCFHAVEPFQAGPTSAHLQADLCQPPLATWKHETYQTLIFDLDQDQSKSR